MCRQESGMKSFACEVMLLPVSKVTLYNIIKLKKRHFERNFQSHSELQTWNNPKVASIPLSLFTSFPLNSYRVATTFQFSNEDYLRICLFNHYLQIDNSVIVSVKCGSRTQQ